MSWEIKWFSILFVLWLLLNIADAWWIYYYVITTVNPIPHTAVNRTPSGWTGFTVMMFIWGFFWSFANVLAGYVYWYTYRHDRYRQSTAKKVTLDLIMIFVAFPIFVFLFVMPFSGGWIVTPLVAKHRWNHGCDSFPMVVVLDAKSYNDPRYVVNVANFYSNSPSSADPTLLFSYEITNPDDGDNWLFSLRTWGEDQSRVPLGMYPKLQTVHYNFVDNSLSGNCTLKDTTATNTSTSVRPCMTGTFDPGDWLHFDITSAVPLNNTLSSQYPASIPNVTTSLGVAYKYWAPGDQHPALILQQVGPSGTLGHEVLKTTVTKPHDSTQLKVCVNGVDNSDGSARTGATVQPEVLAPLGLILMRQADYALENTTPHDDDN